MYSLAVVQQNPYIIDVVPLLLWAYKYLYQMSDKYPLLRKKGNNAGLKMVTNYLFGDRLQT